MQWCGRWRSKQEENAQKRRVLHLNSQNWLTKSELVGNSFSANCSSCITRQFGATSSSASQRSNDSNCQDWSKRHSSINLRNWNGWDVRHECILIGFVPAVEHWEGLWTGQGNHHTKAQCTFKQYWLLRSEGYSQVCTVRSQWKMMSQNEGFHSHEESNHKLQVVCSVVSGTMKTVSNSQGTCWCLKIGSSV